MGRNQNTSDLLYFCKFVCDECETRFADNITLHLEVKDLLLRHTDTVGQLVKQMTVLETKMDNSEEFIDDIDKSLRASDTSNIVKRLDRLEQLLSKLKINPTCSCPEALESLSNSMVLLEKSVTQKFEAKTDRIAQSLHGSFLASTLEANNALGVCITERIGGKIDELASSVADATSLSYYAHSSVHEPISVQQSMTATEVVDVSTNTASTDCPQQPTLSLMEELSLANLESGQVRPGSRSYDFSVSCETTAVNCMAQLCKEFGWSGGVLYSVYAKTVSNKPSESSKNRKRQRKKKSNRTDRPVDTNRVNSGFHTRPTKHLVPIMKTKINDLPHHRRQHPQHRYPLRTHVQQKQQCHHNRHRLQTIIVNQSHYQPRIRASVPPIRWVHEEELHNRFMAVINTTVSHHPAKIW